MKSSDFVYVCNLSLKNENQDKQNPLHPQKPTQPNNNDKKRMGKHLMLSSTLNRFLSASLFIFRLLEVSERLGT